MLTIILILNRYYISLLLLISEVKLLITLLQLSKGVGGSVFEAATIYLWIALTREDTTSENNCLIIVKIKVIKR